MQTLMQSELSSPIDRAQSEIAKQLILVETKEREINDRIGLLSSERTALNRQSELYNLQAAQAFNQPVVAAQHIDEARQQGRAILERVKARRGEATRRREKIESVMARLRAELGPLGEKRRQLEKWQSALDVLRASGLPVSKLEISI